MNPLVKRPLLWSIWGTYKWEMMNLVGLSLGGIIADMMSSLFIMVVADFLTQPEKFAYWKGFVLLFYLAIIKLVQAVFTSQQRIQTSLFSVHLRAGMCTNVYRKCLRTATSEFNLGEVTNLMQVDIERC